MNVQMNGESTGAVVLLMGVYGNARVVKEHAWVVKEHA